MKRKRKRKGADHRSESGRDPDLETRDKAEAKRDTGVTETGIDQPPSLKTRKRPNVEDKDAGNAVEDATKEGMIVTKLARKTKWAMKKRETTTKIDRDQLHPLLPDGRATGAVEKRISIVNASETVIESTGLPTNTAQVTVLIVTKDQEVEIVSVTTSTAIAAVDANPKTLMRGPRKWRALFLQHQSKLRTMPADCWSHPMAQPALKSKAPALAARTLLKTFLFQPAHAPLVSAKTNSFLDLVTAKTRSVLPEIASRKRTRNMAERRREIAPSLLQAPHPRSRIPTKKSEKLGIESAC
jgi:hypothetical protein